MSFPHTTEKIQWGDNLVFKVGGKIYAILALEPGDAWLTLKSTEEDSAALVERPGIVPAPYLARAHWIAVESPAALMPDEVKRLLRRSYDRVVEKLPQKRRAHWGAKTSRR